MINSMVKVKRIGLMAHNMKANICMERNKAMDNSYGLMDPSIMDNSSIIIFKVKVFTFGKMVESTKANGK